jgi:hypothetical protein
VSQVLSEGTTTVKQLAKEAIQNFNNTPTEIAWSPTLLKQKLDPTCWKYGRKIGEYSLLALSRGNSFHTTKMQHA